MPPADDLATRLAFAARWLLAPDCALLVGIVAAGRRGFYPDAIDGTRTPANRGLEIGLRYNQNTLEQVVLAAIAWLGLAIRAPHAGLAFIPAMAVLFVVGRATFWIGYLLHPTARGVRDDDDGVAHRRRIRLAAGALSLKPRATAVPGSS